MPEGRSDWTFWLTKLRIYEPIVSGKSKHLAYLMRARAACHGARRRKKYGAIRTLCRKDVRFHPKPRQGFASLHPIFAKTQRERCVFARYGSPEGASPLAAVRRQRLCETHPAFVSVPCLAQQAHGVDDDQQDGRLVNEHPAAHMDLTSQHA